MQELTARAPTILVLEDLHWADEATLDVLRLLARRVESVPALVLASYRDDELDRGHPLRLVLGELATAHAVSRLSVPPLSAMGVAKLAEPHGVNADELYRATAGNPFFVTEVLAAGSDEIPPTVRDAVLARVARVSPEARTMVEAVAVAPLQMELWLVDALTGEGPERLEECLAAGILIPRPGVVAFRHELARIAIEESLPPDVRAALHTKALAALTSPPKGAPDVARLAHHAEAADDDEAVLRFAPEAAVRAASVGAHREADAQYARALRFAEGLTLDARAELLTRRAQECTLIGEFTEAIALLRAALECHRGLRDARAEGNALRNLSWLLWVAGRTEEAEGAVGQAVGVLEQLAPGRDVILAYCARSNLCRYARDFERALEWGKRALELAEDIDDHEARVHALTHIAMVEYIEDVEAGREKLERGIELARHAGLEDLAANAFCILAFGAVVEHEDSNAEAYIDAGIEYCSEHDLNGWSPFLIAMRAEVELARGRLSDAADSASLVLAGVAIEGRTRPRPRPRDCVRACRARSRAGAARRPGTMGAARRGVDPRGAVRRPDTAAPRGGRESRGCMARGSPRTRVRGNGRRVCARSARSGPLGDRGACLFALARRHRGGDPGRRRRAVCRPDRGRLEAGGGPLGGARLPL